MLQHEIERRNLPRTMLFHGPDGSGKFLTAVEVIRTLNCREKAEEGCGCPSCAGIARLISNDMFILCRSNLNNSFGLWKRFGFNHDNIMFMVRDLRRFLNSISHDERYRDESLNITRLIGSSEELESSFSDLMDTVLRILDAVKGKVITIDQIREAQRFLSLKSGYARYRVLVIDGAETMNEEAQNSFLKISEDTPENSLIILTTISKQNLKPTIVSRCRLYRFKRPGEEQQKDIIKRRFDVQAGSGYTGKELSAGRDTVNEIFVKIQDNMDDLETLGEIADEIGKNGYEVDFFDLIIDLLKERLRSLSTASVHEISGFEKLFMKTERVKRSILYENSNREIALLDFLLNNMRDVVKYCRAGT